MFDEMHHPGNSVLTFVKLPGVLFRAAIFLVLQKRLDKVDELVNGLYLGQCDVVFEN